MKITSFLLALFLLTPPAATAEEMWLAWAEFQHGGNPVCLSHFIQGRWTTEQLPASSHFAANYPPCPGMDNLGNLWIVWAAQPIPGDAKIYFSRRENGNWTEARRVSNSVQGWESNPSLAFDPGGEVWVAWAGDGGASTEIFCAQGKGKGFAPAMSVSRPDESPDSRPLIALDETGNPVISWWGWSGHQSVTLQSRFQNGIWSPEAVAAPLPVFSFSFPSGAAADLPRPAKFLAERRAGLVIRDQSGEWRSRRWPETPPGEISAAATPAPLAENEYTGYGDSITWGTTEKYHCYIPLLRDMLQAAYPGNNFTIYNKGYPSARTYQLLDGGGSWGCPGINAILEKYASTIILIMGGTNDIEDGDDYRDIKWNLAEMIDRSREHKVEPILATIIPRWDTSVMLERSEELSVNYLRPLGTEKGVSLADPWQAYINYGDYHRLYISDKIHPLWPDGSQKIAEAWFAVLPPPPEPTGPLDKIIKWSRDWATGL